MGRTKPLWITDKRRIPVSRLIQKTRRIEKMTDPEMLRRIVMETDVSMYLYAAAGNSCLTEREALMKLALGDDAQTALAAVKRLTEEEDLLAAALHDSGCVRADTEWDEIPENVAGSRLKDKNSILTLALSADHTRYYGTCKDITWKMMAENFAAVRCEYPDAVAEAAKSARSWYVRDIAARRMEHKEEAFDILVSDNPADETQNTAAVLPEDNDTRLKKTAESKDSASGMRKAAGQKI